MRQAGGGGARARIYTGGKGGGACALGVCRSGGAGCGAVPAAGRGHGGSQRICGGRVRPFRGRQACKSASRRRAGTHRRKQTGSRAVLDWHSGRPTDRRRRRFKGRFRLRFRACPTLGAVSSRPSARSIAGAPPEAGRPRRALGLCLCLCLCL